jgi:hypothetical protein
MALPTSIIEKEITDPKLLTLYGPPKVGKTDLLSKLQGCLLIDTEDGSDYVSALKVKVNNLDQLMEVAKEIAAYKKAKGEYPYKFVAIDTITEIENLCEADATAKYKATSMGKDFKGKSVLELANGGGYFWLRQSFDYWLDLITKFAPKVIIIAHLKEKITNKAGVDVASLDLDLTGKIRNILAQKSDAIGYVYRKKDGILRISFNTNEDNTCGSREHLAGADIEADWSLIYPDEFRK